MHSYRYRLDVQCGLFAFRGELNPPGPKGKRYDVEQDPAGRYTRIEIIRDGKKTAEEVFHYTSDNKLPDHFETFANGERTGIVKVQFTDAGCVKRMDFLTVHNVLTAYLINTQTNGGVEQRNYDPNGSEKFRYIFSYNGAGILIHKQVPPRRDTSRSQEIDIDPNTGNRTTLKQFEGAKLTVNGKYTYDDNGTLIRRDAYSAAGNLYGTEEFSAGIPIAQTYSSDTNNVLEFRYSRDLKNWVNETKVIHNGKHVCSLTYQRLSNGSPVRTTAKSPDGDVWADYPDQEVYVINQFGQRAGGTSSVIYKKGPWW